MRSFSLSLCFQGTVTASGLLEAQTRVSEFWDHKSGKDKVSTKILSHFLGCQEMHILGVAQLNAEQRTTFCLNLTAIPIVALPILVWIALAQAHTLAYILNCSLVARVEIPINNALSALFFVLFFFVLPCKWTESTTSVYWNYTVSKQMIIAPFIMWPEIEKKTELYVNYVITHAEMIYMM